MCCNRQIRGFSAGQKVRLSLAAMFWTKPHLIAVQVAVKDLIGALLALAPKPPAGDKAK